MKRTKKEIVKVNGKEFTLFHKVVDKPIGKGCLLHCYDKPSSTKQQIWDEWCKWFCEVSQQFGDYIQVSSYNTFSFTICGIFTTSSGEKYSFYITKTRQELYYVER